MGENQQGANRVLRGGSWINNGRNCRSAYRNNNDPSNRNNNIGFRLARARHAVGMSVYDQILIQFNRVLTKSKWLPVALVTRMDFRVNACRLADS